MTDQHHYFTFGSDHLDGKGMYKYVEVMGDVDEEQARKIVFAMFGPHWSMQYTEREFIDDFSSLFRMTRHMYIKVVKERE